MIGVVLDDLVGDNVDVHVVDVLLPFQPLALQLLSLLLNPLADRNGDICLGHLLEHLIELGLADVHEHVCVGKLALGAHRAHVGHGGIEGRLGHVDTKVVIHGLLLRALGNAVVVKLEPAPVGLGTDEGTVVPAV